MMVKGAVRDIVEIKSAKKKLMLITKNNEPMEVLELMQKGK